MKVLLNVSILRGPITGIGRYTQALARALSESPDIDPLFFDGLSVRKDVTDIAPTPHNRRIERLKRHIPLAYPLRRLLMQHRFNVICRRHRPDVYHEPSLWPLTAAGASVVTVHDLTHIHYPETQPANRLREIKHRCAAGLEKAGSVVVDSEFIAREVVNRYGVPGEKVVVAPLGVSPQFRLRNREWIEPRLKKMGLQYGRYILSVGTLEPRKNLAFTLKAHQELPEQVRRAYPLVLAGEIGWHYDQFSKDLEPGLNEGSVRMMGYLKDEQLAAVNCGGRMLVYPSLYEGFGLPVVEAMASGLPVITSSRAALPEVAGSAAIYVRLDDHRSLAEKMALLIDDEERFQQLREKGSVQASRFTWQNCAEKTISAYRLAANAV